MRVRDTVSLGSKGLREKKVRGALTILMVVVGVASIIALESLTAGIQDSIIQSLSTLGPTLIFVSPTFSASHVTHLTQADVAEIASLPGVASVVPLVTVPVTLESGSRPTSLSIIGVSVDGLTSLLGKVSVLDGSVFPDATAPLALVGYTVAFPSGLPQQVTLGQQLVVQQSIGQGTRTVTLQTTGLLQSYGSSLLIPIDGSIFMPIQAVQAIFNRPDYSSLLVKATSTDTANTVAQYLDEIYGSNAQVITLAQITSTVSSIIGTIGLLLGGIAGISLTVAGIGIMNIMLIAVLERTHEIGIMKSVGFKNRDVLVLFLVESLTIGLVGGIIGLLAGGGFSYVLPVLLTSAFGGGGGGPTASTASRGEIGRAGTGGGGFGSFGGGGGFGGGGSSPVSLSFTPVISPELVAIAIFIAAAVSIIAGLYPAWRAAKMEPIKALRAE